MCVSFSVCVSGYRHCEAPSSTPLVDGPFCTYTARHCHHTIFTGTTQPGGTFFWCHFLCLFPAAIGVKTPSSELPSSKTNLKTTHIKSAQEHRLGLLALRHPHPCWASAAFRRLSSVSKKPPPTQLHVSPVRLPSLDLTLQTPLLDFPAPSAA